VNFIIQYKYMKKNTSCKLKNVDSKSVECANKKIKGKLFDAKFKYAYVKFACEHAGTYSPKREVIGQIKDMYWLVVI